MRFWRSKAQRVMDRVRDELRAKEIAEQHETVLRLRHQLSKAHDEVARLEELLGFRQRAKLLQADEWETMNGLMTVDEDHPVWRAVHRLLGIMERDELSAALRGGQLADDRAFNNGRASCLADAQAMLLQQWSKARASNRAAK